MTIPAGRPGKVCPTLTKQAHGWSLTANGKKMDADKILARTHDEMDECWVKAVQRVGGNVKRGQMILPWGVELGRALKGLR